MSRIIELISEVEKVRVLNDIREEKQHALCCHSEKPAVAWKDAT